MHVEPYTAIRTNCQPKSYTYTVKFDRDITSPEYWQEELDTLRMAKEGDDCVLYLSTLGGSAATMAEVLHIIKHSPAHFHCVLAGTAFSAGGPIMLACDTVEVGDYAELMIHTSQNSYFSSSQGLEHFSAMNARTARKILSTCYEGFLTPDEINQALDGKEFWFDSDEIKQRLTQRDEYFAALDEDDGIGFTKEQMSAMSKDEILAVIFGEDDSDVEDIPNSEVTSIFSEFTKNTGVEVLHNSTLGIAEINDASVIIDKDGNVNFEGSTEFHYMEDFKGDIHFARILCDALYIEYKASHNCKVLVKKIQGFVDKVVAILNQK